MKSLPIIESDSLENPSGPAAPARGRYAFVSLGCPKNLVDSERMLGLLQLDGYQLVADPDDSDFVVVNTCGFIEQARDESFSAIDEMLELKRQGRTHGVIVAGCLAERQKEQLLEDRPEIDHLVGVFGREEITKVADRLWGRLHEQRSVFQPAPIQALPDRNRLRITPEHFAYLKISEGCDRLCTFCAIPRMRGGHVSKPIAEVVDEARELVESGARELILVAQDTTYYGLDLYGEPRLADLLHELQQVNGVQWIRLMYFYPMYISDQLIDTIADSSKILPYIDLPLQHINDTMLRRMARRVTRAETELLLRKLRERIPDLAIRTTLITGFPGETESHFQELLDFVQQQQFERLGVFEYSLESDTPAANLADHVPPAMREQRRRRVMEVQQQLMFQRNERLVGTQVQCILDRPFPDQPNVWIGRTQADAPDVDASVFVSESECRLSAGDIVPCEVVACRQYDLVAVAMGQPR